MFNLKSQPTQNLVVRLAYIKNIESPSPHRATLLANEAQLITIELQRRNLAALPTYLLIRRIAILNYIKERNIIYGMELTQTGLDWINTELSMIDVELNSRKPDMLFQILLGDNNEPVGFEPQVEFESEYLDDYALELPRL